MKYDDGENIAAPTQSDSEPDIEDLRREVAVAEQSMDAGDGEAWDVEDFKARLIERHRNRIRGV